MGNGYRGRAPLSPRFQQRHYEVIAQNLHRSRHELLVNISPDTEAVWQSMVSRLACEFSRDNEHFKPAKFYKACGWDVDQ